MAVPVDPTHEYDFTVYEREKAFSSTGIKGQKLKVVRKCYGVMHYNQSGPRGLSHYGTKEILQIGRGNTYGYVTPLPVKAGETYYIEVIWPYENTWQKGFKLYLSDWGISKRIQNYYALLLKVFS